MTAMQVTFLGGPDCGNVGETVWGTKMTGQIVFPIRTPVLIDPDAPGNVKVKPLMQLILAKAPRHPHFRVEPVAEGKTVPPATIREPVKEAKSPSRAAAKA